MKTYITFSIDALTKRQAQHKALDAGLTLTKILRELIDLWLDDEISTEHIGDGNNSAKPRK
jgi:hypothetical protein